MSNEDPAAKEDPGHFIGKHPRVGIQAAVYAVSLDQALVIYASFYTKRVFGCTLHSSPPLKWFVQIAANLSINDRPVDAYME